MLSKKPPESTVFFHLEDDPKYKTTPPFLTPKLENLHTHAPLIRPPFPSCVSHFLSPTELRKWVMQPWKGSTPTPLWSWSSHERTSGSKGPSGLPFYGCITHFLSSTGLRKQETQPGKGRRIKGAQACKFSNLGVRKGGLSYTLGRLVNGKIR